MKKILFTWNDSQCDAYPEEVFLIKKMMEIIGSEPILEYIFTDNFNSISDAIKPYLSDEEYSAFLSDLKVTYIDSEDYNQSESNEKYASLDNLLDIIYQRKFGINIDEDFKIKNEDDIAILKCIVAFFYVHIEEYNYDYNQLKAMCYFYLENKKDFKEKVQISNQDEIEDINDKEFIISNCYANRKLMKKIVL